MKELVYFRAIEKWGKDNQKLVIVEELAELSKELTKMLRVDAQHDLGNIAEEVADVEIAIELLEVIYDVKLIADIDKIKLGIKPINLIQQMQGLGCYVLTDDAYDNVLLDRMTVVKIGLNNLKDELNINRSVARWKKQKLNRLELRLLDK
ncbi:MAG: hypothetical protein ACRDD7_06130 [Peptostreptococcaceae bacterium]